MDTIIEEMHLYGEKGGWQQMRFMKECVSKGDSHSIQKFLENPEILEKEQRLFQCDLQTAVMTFLYLWPQLSHTAICAGVSERIASEIFMKHSRLLFKAHSVEEILRMNIQINIEYALAVKAAKKELACSPIVRKCRSYIRAHVYDQISMEDMAKNLGYSKSHLSHVYKQETGETIYQQVQREKIAEARLLLLNPLLNLNEIQSQLGYSSQSHFTQHFKKETGMTPNKYRAKYR